MKQIPIAIFLALAAIQCASADDPFYPSPAVLDTSRLILPRDLQYQGAFKLSTSLAGSKYGLTYLIGAMTFYPNGDAAGAADGFPGSMFIGGHSQEQMVAEISIPAPVNSKNIDALPVAQIISPFRRLGSTSSPSGISVMDIEYMPAQGTQKTDKILATHGDAYLPPDGQKSFVMADVNFANQTAPRSFLPDAAHCYNDYLFAVPSSWANRYAPGMLLAGGRHREGDLCGEGPALSVMAPWSNPTSSTVTTLPILRYKQSGGGLKSYSRGGDVYYAGTWIESGSKSAVLFTGRKGMGKPAYGNYCNEQGYHDLNGYRPYVIFYDPDELGKVALRQMEPHIPQPYAAINLNDVLIWGNKTTCDRNFLNAFAYDSVRKILYAGESSNGEIPVIHVWKIVDNGVTPVDPPPTPTPCSG
ncbi:MAG: hypothetical protein JWP91_4151 [Fibrobacteres bacterium]|nr:hypothetical protein [Fibrobacterota bacterium]